MISETNTNGYSTFSNEGSINYSYTNSTDGQNGQTLRNENLKPNSFEYEFQKAQSSFNEQSPIRPSKYFASDSALNASKGLRNIIISGFVF